MSAVDVIIVGLGPTGLLLAHVLGKAGHKVVVLEREPQFYGNARAVYTDDECMRLLQSVGLAEEAQAKMLIDTPVQLVRPDGTTLGHYAPRRRRFGWPVVNFFYQPYLETTLSEALARYPNVEVRRGRDVTGFVQDDDGVTVTHHATQHFRFREDDDAKTSADVPLDEQTLHARYLVGADGGRSVVRTKLGIEMTGKNFPEPWLVVDLEQKDRRKGLRHLPYFSFVVDPDLPTVVCVQPDGFHRFEFRLKPGETKEELEKPETVRRLVSKWVDPEQFHVKRRLVYTFNALVANTWRDRRVMLAGDAAHMTPQFMGQGASSGFRDAANLGWKLSHVLRGHASDALLDSYERERKPHARAMIETSVRLKDAVSMTNPALATLRDWTVTLLKDLPGIGSYFTQGEFKPKPAYARGEYFGIERTSARAPEGTLSPQPEVRTFEGRRVRLDELTGDGWALLGHGVDPRETLSESARVFLSRLDTRFVTVFAYGERPQGLGPVSRDHSDGLIEVEDLDGDLLTWLRRSRGGTRAVAILRPDKFAYAVVRADNLNFAVGALQSGLGA